MDDRLLDPPVVSLVEFISLACAAAARQTRGCAESQRATQALEDIATVKHDVKNCSRQGNEALTYMYQIFTIFEPRYSAATSYLINQSTAASGRNHVG